MMVVQEVRGRGARVESIRVRGAMMMRVVLGGVRKEANMNILRLPPRVMRMVVEEKGRVGVKVKVRIERVMSRMSLVRDSC